MVKSAHFLNASIELKTMMTYNSDFVQPLHFLGSLKRISMYFKYEEAYYHWTGKIIFHYSLKHRKGALRTEMG